MNAISHMQLILSCKQFDTLSEIVKAGNVQGAHVCACGNWEYAGIPANCGEGCKGPYRLFNEQDLTYAEIVYLCECGYDLPECDGRVCGNEH